MAGGCVNHRVSVIAVIVGSGKCQYTARTITDEFCRHIEHGTCGAVPRQSNNNSNNNNNSHCCHSTNTNTIPKTSQRLQYHIQWVEFTIRRFRAVPRARPHGSSEPIWSPIYYPFGCQSSPRREISHRFCL